MNVREKKDTYFVDFDAADDGFSSSISGCTENNIEKIVIQQHGSIQSMNRTVFS